MEPNLELGNLSNQHEYRSNNGYELYGNTCLMLNGSDNNHSESILNDMTTQHENTTRTLHEPTLGGMANSSKTYPTDIFGERYVENHCKMESKYTYSYGRYSVFFSLAVFKRILFATVCY
jgi:hypothetical protein